MTLATPIAGSTIPGRSSSAISVVPEAIRTTASA